MSLILCESCKKPITNKTEVEYSEEYGCFYCNFDCALDDLFDKARCAPIDFSDKKALEQNEVVVKKGKLHWKQ